MIPRRIPLRKLAFLAAVACGLLVGCGSSTSKTAGPASAEDEANDKAAQKKVEEEERGPARKK